MVIQHQRYNIDFVIRFVGKAITGFFQKLVECILLIERNKKAGQDTRIGSGVIAVMKHGDVPALAEPGKKFQECTRPLGKLDPVHPLIFEFPGGMATHHVADMKLGSLVVCQVLCRIPLRIQLGDEFTKVFTARRVEEWAEKPGGYRAMKLED